MYHVVFYCIVQAQSCMESMNRYNESSGDPEAWVTEEAPVVPEGKE